MLICKKGNKNWKAEALNNYEKGYDRNFSERALRKL
jgi:hypothetical protein